MAILVGDAVSTFTVAFTFGRFCEFSMSYRPNPVAEAIGTVSSAIAVHVVTRQWLSFR